jgi:hypothetical protein
VGFASTPTGLAGFRHPSSLKNLHILREKFRENTAIKKTRDFVQDLGGSITELELKLWYRSVVFLLGHGLEGYLDDHHVFFSFEPRRGTLPPGLLQFHMSQFSTISQFKQWSADLFGSLSSQIIEQGRIDRLDLCVNLAIPYPTISQSISLPGCRTFERWSSDGGRTLYMGSRPFLVRLYEKSGVPIEDVDCIPKNSPADFGHIDAVRIEIELHGKKIPIKTLSEVDKLQTISPFERLRFQQVSQVQLKSLKSSHVVQHFLKRSAEIGFAPAKKEFNSSSNFSKTIAPYIGKLDIDLNKIWKKRINRFLGLRASERRPA